jgi:hypothetical protein
MAINEAVRMAISRRMYRMIYLAKKKECKALYAKRMRNTWPGRILNFELLILDWG